MNTLDTSEHFLTPQEEQTLMGIARAALEAAVIQGQTLDVESFALTPALREPHGAFVTLRKQGELRGCIGYTANMVPLAQAVQENAVNAAKRDPRFNEVTAAEVPLINIEISVLTPGDEPEYPFKRVNDVGEIVLGRDGLYIERPNSRGGILLPQVPLEQGWDLQQFLAAVCRKAGYPDAAWQDPETKLYRFSAQVFGEH